MKQEKLVKKFKKIIEAFELECNFEAGAVNISLVSPQSSDKVYYGSYSNDTIPQMFKLLFATAEQLYEYIAETTCDQRIQIKNPSELTILYTVGKNLKSAPLTLCEKILSNEERLTLKIKQLESEIQELRQRAKAGEEVLLLQIELQKKDRQICYFTVQLEQFQRRHSELHEQLKIIKQSPLKIRKQDEFEFQNLRKENQFLKRQNQDLIAEKEYLRGKSQSFEIQNRQLNIKRQNVQNQLKSKQFTIDKLKSGFKHNDNNEGAYQQIFLAPMESVGDKMEIKEWQKQENYQHQQPQKEYRQNLQQQFGKLLVFRPLTSSINYNFYEFKNNILTKFDQIGKTAGKMIPCAGAIPKTGKYCYKVRSKYFKDKPNFRIGITAKRNLISESYISGKDIDTVMFYCQKNQQSIISQGDIQKQGFKINNDNVLMLVVDQNQGLVKWYIDDELKQVTSYTESMKKAQNLNLFFQLWTNGDSLEMLTK